MKKNLILGFLALVIVPVVLQRGGMIGYGPFHAEVPVARNADQHRERPTQDRGPGPGAASTARDADQYHERPLLGYQVPPPQPELKCECPSYDYSPQVEVIREPRYSWDAYCGCWIVEVIEYHRFLR